MSISVVIGTYGDESWKETAMTAYKSVLDQTMLPVDVVHVHTHTLAEARNLGAEQVTGEWLIFLDADDTLDRRYVASMSEWCGDKPMLLQPSTLGVHADGREDAAAVLIPERPLDTGNFMVIGTAIRRDQFFKVGGFKEWPMYEDWCLWIRAWQDGAAFQPVPDAIYRVGVNDKGRNSADQRQQVRCFKDIRMEYFG